jgi:acyl dehydratase
MSGLRVADVAVGDALPETSLTLSVQRLVMIAAANRDFAPTHHDAEIARATGAGNAYGNMMFVMTMMERGLFAWAGSSARLRGLESVRMVAFNEAGRTITCAGTVTGVDPVERRVRLDLWLLDDSGRHTASAAAVLELDD